MLRRMSIRSSSKEELLKDDKSESEKGTPKGIDKDNKKEKRTVQSDENKKLDLKVKQQKIIPTENTPSSKLKTTKRLPENVFNDSDEEPLGNKVGQSSEILPKNNVKKVKTPVRKADTSPPNGQAKVTVKSTKRKPTQEVSKESIKPTQALTRSRQSVKNANLDVSDVEKRSNNSEKPKQEPVTKLKPCENNVIEKPVITKVKSKIPSSSKGDSNEDLENKKESTEIMNSQIKQQIKKKIVKPNIEEIGKEKEEVNMQKKTNIVFNKSFDKDELKQNTEEKTEMVFQNDISKASSFKIEKLQILQTSHENNDFSKKVSGECIETRDKNEPNQQSNEESESQILNKDVSSLMEKSNIALVHVKCSKNKKTERVLNSKGTSPKLINNDNVNKRKSQNNESPTLARKGKDIQLVKQSHKKAKTEKKSNNSNEWLKGDEDEKTACSNMKQNLNIQSHDNLETKNRKLHLSMECTKTESIDQIDNKQNKISDVDNFRDSKQESNSEVKLTESKKLTDSQEKPSIPESEKLISKNECISHSNEQVVINDVSSKVQDEPFMKSTVLEAPNEKIQNNSVEHSEDIKVNIPTVPIMSHDEMNKHNTVTYHVDTHTEKQNRKNTISQGDNQVIDKDIQKDVTNAFTNNMNTVNVGITNSVQLKAQTGTNKFDNVGNDNSSIETSLTSISDKQLLETVRFLTDSAKSLALNKPVMPVAVNAPVTKSSPIMLPLAPIVLPLAVNQPITLPVAASAALNIPVVHTVSAPVTRPTAVNVSLVKGDVLKNKKLEIDESKMNKIEIKSIKTEPNKIQPVVTNESFEKKIEPKYMSYMAVHNKTIGAHHFTSDTTPTQPGNNLLLNQQNFIEAKREVPVQVGNYDSVNFVKDFRTEERKLIIKEEINQESSMKADSFEMSDKISSAVDSLMSLKHVKKLDDKVETLCPTGSSLKHFKSSEVEMKKFQRQELDFKRMQEIESKRFETPHESKRVKFQDNEIKRVTIQDPECKRVTIVEPRTHAQESDVKRFQVQDYKPKPEHSHVLKGCSNPKSMLKPGTLIDIAGISHSPDIMTPLRPGSDGEIIPMGKPIRLDMPENYKLAIPGVKSYEPRAEQNFYGYRWQSPHSEKNNIKPEQIMEKETSDNKSRLPVNETAWRLAFKNVKDPASNNNVPAEKPAARKQLSVTALAKRHSKSKSEVISGDKVIQPQPPIPFLRQNKPFLGTTSPAKSKAVTETISNPSSVKKNSGEIDLSTLREKEAEVEEFVRQYVTGGLSRSFTPIVAPQTFTVSEEHSKMSPGESIPRSDRLSCATSSLSPCEPQDQICTNKQLNPQVRPISRPLSLSHDQTNTNSFLVYDNKKRAVSPFKGNKSLPESSITLTDSRSTVNNATLLNITSNQDLNQTTQHIDVSAKRFDVQKPQFSKSASYFIDDQSNKFVNSLQQYTSNPETFQASTVIGGQSSDNVFQHIQSGKIRHSSPTPFQNVSGDNLFKDIDVTKRTKSPTLPTSYPLLSSSPQANSIKRNSSSPVSIKCSKNIFKEVVPATRSFSPTSSSASQSENDSLSNIFSSNPTFKRSISPLCNKPAFLTSSGSVVVKDDPIRNINIADNKPVESNLQDDSKIPLKTVSQNNDNIEQPNTDPITCDETTLVPATESPQDGKLTEVKDIEKQEENQNTNSVSGLVEESNNSVQQDVEIIPSPSSVSISKIVSEENKSSLTGPAEAKHRLPLSVEQTLKKLGQAKPSLNKKISQLQTNKSHEENKAIGNIQNEESSSQSLEYISPEVTSDDKIVKSTTNLSSGKLSTGIYSHDQAGELDLGLKKKVNMSNEEINRWLNESSNESSLIEHRVNCGILENNICECEYSNITTSSYHAIETPKSERLDDVNSPQSKNLDFVKTDVTDREKVTSPLVASSNKTIDSKGSDNVSGKDETTGNQTKTKEMLFDLDNSNTEGVCSVAEVQKEKSMDATKKTAGKDLTKVSLNLSTPSKNSQNSESQQEPPTTPPVTKTKTFRLPPKSTDGDQEASISEMSSPPIRDDISSSNDVSSSNEETPDKFAHPERRAIFHQRRSALKVKERRELLSPSVGAFSPENESSVYAFEPDLPPASTPFRRSKGKDSRSTNTTTDDDDSGPSSNSIAVQVNFDNEAVLECSTQTDVQEGDDDDMHTFYIPLQKSNTDTTKPPLFQGVAVKVDTEGPDQKVIMRAKLVTKPLSTFNRTSSTPARGLIGPRSGGGAGRPEQKVRPLSVKPPVGTVQPTARPKPKDTETPGPSNTCSPQATRLAKRTKNKVAVPSTSTSDSVAKVTPAKLVEAPTFYPTEKEFEDPLEYIDSITHEAEKYGLCRVVPPSNFKPECKVSDDMRFTAYNQYIHKMLHRWGPNVKEMLAIKKYLATQSINLNQPPWGRSMPLSSFYRIARNTMSMWFPKTETPSAADVELEFWKHVASRQHHVCVNAGSIDSGSVGYGFPTGKNSSTSRHPWNLKMLTNNPGSVLRFLGPIMGVTVPTLHVGMLFSACCWYRDPHGLPWIEYLHTGASKIWYGIPDSSSAQFRSAVMSLVPRLCRDKTLWLASDTAMVPPPLLVERGVSLSRIVQDPGQFIIVFPKAFTSSVCTGYLVSESVYFAQPSWLATAQNLFNWVRRLSQDNQIKQRRAWPLLGQVTAERSCPLFFFFFFFFPWGGLLPCT
ncbi:Jumonji and AT-rich interaction domain containing 2, variant 2 [Homalodisca vitripennis]|nr:Jumonji and AT-rich interaction domain containing 2, variant 2 [Homalodisca vitripennis]